MIRPEISKECVVPVLENKYINVVDLQYAEGRHYFDASRHKPGEVVASKSDEEFKKMLPDAVTCFVIIKVPGEEEKLLFVKEFRYPLGRFVIAPPAGLMDPDDKEKENPLFETAKREIKEETGMTVKDSDRMRVVNPLAFSSPGMTDESNGLVSVVMETDDLTELTNAGAEITECFDGFMLIDKAKAKELLEKGTDDNGFFYSMYSWAALMYFVSDMWK